MAVTKGGHWFPSAHVDVAYFTVNHQLLLGTPLEAGNSTRDALEPEMHVKAPTGVLAGAASFDSLILCQSFFVIEYVMQVTVLASSDTHEGVLGGAAV